MDDEDEDDDDEDGDDDDKNQMSNHHLWPQLGQMDDEDEDDDEDDDDDEDEEDNKQCPDQTSQKSRSRDRCAVTQRHLRWHILVIWDLFFGACHFCSFETVDLATF